MASSKRSGTYKADLLGNIRHVLQGLHGYRDLCLELIENADDARASKLEFDFRPDKLLVTNNAAFTNCGMQGEKCGGDPSGRKKHCDFHALSIVGSGNKARNSNQIGRFGIGFVSVYQITDRPSVRSGNGQLILHPAESRYDYSKIKKVQGPEFTLPWAFEKSLTRQELEFSPLKKSALDEIASDFEKAASESLYFIKSS